MSVERGFLKAICEAPGDDAPRMIYADWLDENGDPERAEFIRAQCRLASMDEFDPGRADLLVREHRLLQAHEKKWRKPVAKLTSKVEFARGFIERMTLATDTFLNYADAIFDAVPLTDLRPTQVKTRWDDLLASPHLERLRTLDLHFSQIGVGRTAEVAGCERLTELRELNLGTGQIQRNGMRAVFASQCLAGLERLLLNKNHAGDDAFTDLSESNFPRLRHLNLDENGITPAGADHLAKADWLGRLESLDLSANPLGDEGVRKLAESDIWSGLRTLRLTSTKADAAGARAVARCRHLAELRELALTGDRNARLLGELARSPVLTKLRSLDMVDYWAAVADDEAEALVRAPFAVELRSLHLRGLTPAGLRTVLTAPSLAGLRRLGLSCHGKAPAELTELISGASHLANLTHLDLSLCRLGPEGAAAVARCPHLAGLIDLDLGGNDLTLEAIEALIASPHLNRLKRLRLKYRVMRFKAPDDLEQRLAERFGAGVCED